jgi:kojibiose phosphorylase
MLQYLLADDYPDYVVRANYAYYAPRTDHTFGSSLGPSIQAIMACRVDRPDEAYDHFIRAARADLRDVRGNAGDGIHGASAAGTWQAVVFGFGGLNLHAQGWNVSRLPAHWKRTAHFSITACSTSEITPEVTVSVGMIFDLDGAHRYC